MSSAIAMPASVITASKISMWWKPLRRPVAATTSCTDTATLSSMYCTIDINRPSATSRRLCSIHARTVGSAGGCSSSKARTRRITSRTATSMSRWNLLGATRLPKLSRVSIMTPPGPTVPHFHRSAAHMGTCRYAAAASRFHRSTAAPADCMTPTICAYLTPLLSFTSGRWPKPTFSFVEMPKPKG